MKPEDGTNHLTETDPYATRAPSPESLDALELARESSKHREDGPKPLGVSREEFDRGLIECGFLDAEELRSIQKALSIDDQPIGSETLARHLVHLRKLTRYQASALFQGKGRSLLIGPYVVLDKLGSGGMGMVFKARLRKQGGSEVALKLLPPSASKHPRAVLRFRREAEIMEKLDHPNVVSSHEIGQYHGVHYLVMDYVEGRDLERVVRSGGPMKLVRAVDCLIQAARGLAAAHGQGIVHRDIKPANLLLDSKGVVRVLDLGLARVTQGDDSVKDAASAPSLTASGIIMGTVDFLPPEQSDDSKRADHRADIYALGCTLYFLLTGKPPYSGESIMQRLLAHHQKPIPSLRDARPDVPIEIDAIYQKMMAKSPDDRPQSIAEVADSLEAWRSRSAKSLRVFDKRADSKRAATEANPKSEGSNRKPPEDTEPYDLLTFVRDELLEPDSGTTQREPSTPLPRKSKRSRNQKSPLDLLIRGLVGAAALAVLFRFFPKDLFRSERARPATPPEVSAKVEPILVVEPPPKVEPPVMVPGPEPSKPKIPSLEPVKTVQPPAESPPPGPSLLEELLRPPPPRPGEGSPAAKKKGQALPRGPGLP
jgi:serine/threonine protein kinase